VKASNALKATDDDLRLAYAIGWLTEEELEGVVPRNQPFARRA
jgi:hypothetical protein